VLLIGKGVEPLHGTMMQNSEDVSLHDLGSIFRYLLPRRWELLPDMSALGHQQTFAVQNTMSALVPIATCAVQLGISALGQKRTFAPQFVGHL
jgi:hypothetical protein